LMTFCVRIYFSQHCPARDWSDMNVYAEAKTEVIESILSAS